MMDCGVTQMAERKKIPVLVTCLVLLLLNVAVLGWAQIRVDNPARSTAKNKSGTQYQFPNFGN